MLEGSIEIFIHYESVCIFYYNLSKPKAKPTLDKQLISGFLSANSLFFDELGIGGNANLFRIIRGDSELRMALGKKIHATLLLNNLNHLDLKAYYELDLLTRSIIDRFEEKYIEEIEAFIMTGEFRFEGIEVFIRHEVDKMKAHMYSAYLMEILGKAINRNVKKKEAKELLIALNHVFADYSIDYVEVRMHLEIIWHTIANYQRIHPTFSHIIKKVNNESKHVWKLFRVPVIPVLSRAEFEKKKII